MSDAAGAFDREFAIGELLRGVPIEVLAEALAGLVGAGARLADAAGATVCGGPAPGARREGVQVELEPIAYLECAPADAARLPAATRLLALLLEARRRYLMVSDLHTEAINADYLELQRRHAALQDSEERYRRLSEQLERRVAEQVALIDEKQRQLYQAEKLASIGQLAAGVAHEINNPIGFVRSNLSSSLGYVKRLTDFAARLAAGEDGRAAWRALDLDFLLEDFRDLLRESTDGIDRVARIVRDLKGFSSVDRPDEEVVNLNDNLATVCNIVAGQLPEGARLQRCFGELPPLMCLPGHLNQVFLNLVTNAVQVIGAEGEITVTSEFVAGEILVRVADTGPGMAPEVLARIFDPFFTTRAVGSGTGLGLTVARDIVQAHGGAIEVDTRPGAGAVFTVHLPA